MVFSALVGSFACAVGKVQLPLVAGRVTANLCTTDIGCVRVRSFTSPIQNNVIMARGMKVLNVAEKNDAAKSLADLMSRGRYRRVSSVMFSSLVAVIRP